MPDWAILREMTDRTVSSKPTNINNNTAALEGMFTKRVSVCLCLSLSVCLSVSLCLSVCREILSAQNYRQRFYNRQKLGHN